MGLTVHLIDLSKPATQETIGRVIGASRQNVSDVERRGIAGRDDPLGVWLQAYIAHLRETAAGRAGSDGGLDLVAERARLARAQAVRVETANSVAARELAPVSILSDVLARVGRQIAVLLEAVPVQLKRRYDMDIEQLEFITGEIVRARNLAAAIELDLSDLETGNGMPDGTHDTPDPEQA